MTRTLAQNARDQRPVGLVTGAFMAWARPAAAETDGPVGVAALAAALTIAGARPTVITDEPCEPVVRACLDVVGLGAALVVVPVNVSEATVIDIVADIRPAQLIAVERLGPNAEGRVLTMRGVDISRHTAPLHAAFEKTDAVTGSIGDGGNEVGMANVPVDAIASVLENGRQIASAHHVEHLVAAGTSNWGCYAAITALATLIPRHALELSRLVHPSMDDKLLEAATAAGGIDGVTGTLGRSVDGIPVNEYSGLLMLLHQLALRAVE